LGVINGVLFRLTVPNPEHLAKLMEGVKEWNQWRKLNPDVPNEAWDPGIYFQDEPDLKGADLSGKDLREADLRRANLIEANLAEADLRLTNLRAARLIGANLRGAKLIESDLFGADLRRADLSEAILREANLIEAKLNGARLYSATLVRTNLEGADLTSCSVHGISVWDVKLKGTIQSNLVITPTYQSVIEVDNLEVAQFIYLLLNNEKIRHVIDTITSKVVLILGRFTEERKDVLDAIREALRKRDYLPILFDFEKPSSTVTA
jgi:hypothetical protein